LNVTGITTGTAADMMNAAGYADNLMVSFSGLSGATDSAALVLNYYVGGGTFDTTVSGGSGVNVNTYNVQSSGSATNTVIVGGNDTTLTTINITCSDSINLTNCNTGVRVINGGAATGNQTIITGALNGKATITGGSGSDTLNASAATKTVHLADGAGVDTLIFNGNAAGNVIKVGSGADRAGYPAEVMAVTAERTFPTIVNRLIALCERACPAGVKVTSPYVQPAPTVRGRPMTVA
jgi:hypothetical protein